MSAGRGSRGGTRSSGEDLKFIVSNYTSWVESKKIHCNLLYESLSVDTFDIVYFINDNKNSMDEAD